VSDPAWIVMLEDNLRRWGGDLRRGSLFRRLAERTDAAVLNSFSARKLRFIVGTGPWLIPGPFPFLRRWGPRPRLASAEMMRPGMVRIARRVTDLTAVAVYDDAVAQAAALGIEMSPERERNYRRRRRANVEGFRWLVVPTRSFAELVGLDMSRVIVAGNGTHASHIRPGPWPTQPTIGMMSGAAPGRGIGTLIEAAELLKSEVPDLRLRLWLVATGSESAAYLSDLAERHASDRWMEISSVPYAEIGPALATASVLVVPAPPGDYFEAGLPVKLFDSMAAGRPLVVTPRLETRAVVERQGAGLVTPDDTPDSMAAAIGGLLGDEARLRELGRAAREAAEQVYDWPVVGDRVASEILAREGLAEA
jgi:glycosyltransferase involved in cell wall biosynthesis